MDPPLKPSEEVCSCPYLDFGLLALGIMKEKLPVLLSHLVHGNLLLLYNNIYIVIYWETNTDWYCYF